MRHLAPVLRCDQDGGEAHGEVAPLQDVSPRPPPALDTQGVGGVAALALEVNTQTLKTLPLPHGGQQAAPGQGGAALTGVGDEVIERDSGVTVAVPARPEPDPKAKDEDDEKANCHQQPQNCLSWYFCFNLPQRQHDISRNNTEAKPQYNMYILPVWLIHRDLLSFV